MKKIAITILSAIALSLTNAACDRTGDATLPDLQKRAVFAQTEEEKAAVLQDLLDYYAQLTIPDTVKQKVEAELKQRQETFLVSLKNNGSDHDESNGSHHSESSNGHDRSRADNPYALEKTVEDNFRKALIAKSLGQTDASEALLSTCRKDAQTIITLGGPEFWDTFLKQILNNPDFNAMHWLKADIAKTLCRYFSNSDDDLAHALGGYGLRLLDRIEDTRLKSNLLSKLQVTLYFNRRYALAVLLSDAALKLAADSRFYLIQNGSILFRGHAFREIGQSDEALQAFHESIRIAEKYSDVPQMDYFAKSARTEMLNLLIEIGDYKSAEELGNEQRKNFNFDEREQISLNIALGRLNKSLGNYTIADSLYRKALLLARQGEDRGNEIKILHNLGTLYCALKDFDEALFYAQTADSLASVYQQNNYQLRSLVSTGLAEIFAANGDRAGFRREIDRTMKFIENIDQPFEKAYAFDAIGQASLVQRDFKSAAASFEEAIRIYNEYGAGRRALFAEIKRAECLLGGADLNAAESVIEHCLASANRMNDRECVIDALALKASLRDQQNETTEAIRISEELIAEIDRLGADIPQLKLQLLYRQKFYHHIKSAAVYALHAKDRRLALDKLNYAKSSMMRVRLENGFTAGGMDASLQTVLPKSIYQNLGQNGLAIDYLLTSDAIYAFVLFQNKLEVLHKKIDLAAFSAKIDSFKTAIQILPDEPDQVAFRYKTVTRLGADIGETLLGWRKLRACLQAAEITYIVPDQYLYDLPFAALQLDKEDDRSFLIQETALAIAPNISCLQNGGQSLAALSEKRILVSADRRFEASRAFLKRMRTEFARMSEPKLKDENIEKQHLLDELNRAYDVHIYVGHGLIDEVSPEKSMIRVTYFNESSSRRDTMNISLKDLEKVEWGNVELVFLVGCETARGKSYLAFGALGLQQKLLSEGAGIVVGNLWKIDAHYAIPQTGKILSYLKTSGKIARALRKVQLEAIQSIRNDPFIQYPLPYFWANHVISTFSTL